MKLLPAVVLGVALSLAAPATASAAPVAVAPIAGSVTNTPRPTFSWSLAEGETVTQIFLSRSSSVDENGWIVRGNDGVLYEPATGTSFRMPAGYVLEPGTYYWQVAGYDAEGQPTQSPITAFKVPPVMQFFYVRMKAERHPSSGKMAANFYGRVRGNLGTACKITLVVKRKGTRIFSQKRMQDCNGWIKSSLFMNWPNGTVRRGVPVTAQLVITGGGKTVRSQVMSFRTP